MIKLIQSITLTQIVLSVIVLIPIWFLFRYWIRKKKSNKIKRKEERKQHHLNCLLPFDNMEFENGYDESERNYHTDDREVEYYRK